jgi:plastocyanin
MPTPSPTPTATPPAQVTITINGIAGGMSFSPASATVSAGQSVVWQNADAITHTATGGDFDTGPIGPGQTSAPVTFSTAGARPYHCTIHPSMTGTLTVTAQ